MTSHVATPSKEACGFDPGTRMFMCRADDLERELAKALASIAVFRRALQKIVNYEAEGGGRLDTVALFARAALAKAEER